MVYKLKQGIKVSGRGRFILKDAATGRIKVDHTYGNLVLPAGLKWVAGRCVGNPTEANISGIAVGTDNTAAADTDTALGAEVGEVDLALDPWLGTGVDASKFYMRGIFSASEGNGTLAESGIKIAGELFNRLILSPTVTKTSSDVLVVEFEISIEDT